MVGLVVVAGVVSRAGRRVDNQDFAAVSLGTAAERAAHGVVAVLADGVGGALGGRIAAELACRSFIDAYMCQPETLGIAACADRALAGYNRWLHAMGAHDPAMAGAATTFAAVIVRGRRAHALHCGDSRAWHHRDGVLTRLTDDHALSHPDQRHVLYRAVGLESAVRLDHAVQSLSVHDRLLITSDGVHGVLSHRALVRLLDHRGSAEGDAAAIVAAALDAGSADNVTAVVLDVVGLPEPDGAGIAAIAAALPVLPPPNLGDSIDGFRLDRLLSDSRTSRLFVASDLDGAACVLKFPKPDALSDPGARGAFLREALIGARVHSPYVAEMLSLQPERQTRLYVAMPFYAGETLEARLQGGRLSLPAGLKIGADIARGLVALHRRGIVHRDVKPANVLLAADGGPARLLDLGVARLPQVEEFADPEIPGTPSFMAPELYEGDRGTPATDQFALGITLYLMFTGRYPYGEIEPFTHPRFGRPADPSRLRADLPGWLATLLQRAVAVRPEERFADVLELLAVIEGSARAAPRLRRRPLAQRHPARFWQTVSLLLAALLLLSLALR